MVREEVDTNKCIHSQLLSSSIFVYLYISSLVVYQVLEVRGRLLFLILCRFLTRFRSLFADRRLHHVVCDFDFRFALTLTLIQSFC